MDKCLLCKTEPCSCKCSICGTPEESSYFPSASDEAVDGLEKVSNLTLDSISMTSANLEPRLIKAGWKYQRINDEDFRYRVICRLCMVRVEQAREVWTAINKERQSKDSYQPHEDPFYQQLVGADAPDGSEPEEFYSLFQD